MYLVVSGIVFFFYRFATVKRDEQSNHMFQGLVILFMP
jgi:hypothetical protein